MLFDNVKMYFFPVAGFENWWYQDLRILKCCVDGQREKMDDKIVFHCYIFDVFATILLQ